MQRLSFNGQAILSVSTESFTQLAQLADKISEVRSDSQSIVCATSNSKNDQSDDVLSVLTRQIESLTVQVHRLTMNVTGKTFPKSVIVDGVRVASSLVKLMRILRTAFIIIHIRKRLVNVLHQVI
ncbi:hypothetical protein NPIL_101311 [Nephila pilipes]|uniref:Uncharacterized protein n=1 Tax=Nephila pilipes TaxID=299642 RepID=A0A8X6TN10_NEPPI|nr:hypothetical protein NPIL_101311 [Nephila pilipes]